MEETFENEQERLFNPCVVYNHDIKAFKISRESVRYKIYLVKFLLR